jgi:hypothetical protein
VNLLTRYDTRQKHIDLLRTVHVRPRQRQANSGDRTSGMNAAVPPRRACISCSALVDVAAGPSPDVENPTSGGDLGPSGSTLGPPSGAQNAIGKWRTVSDDLHPPAWRHREPLTAWDEDWETGPFAYQVASDVAYNYKHKSTRAYVALSASEKTGARRAKRALSGHGAEWLRLYRVARLSSREG